MDVDARPEDEGSGLHEVASVCSRSSTSREFALRNLKFLLEARVIPPHAS
jgi:hypothetical protein